MKLALLSAFLALPVLAGGDCDPCNIMKPLTCAERIARAKAHGCIVQADPQIVTVTKEVPGPERIVTKEVRVEVPGPTVVKYVEPEEEYKGHFLLGAGPVRFHAIDGSHAWGFAGVAGWQFAKSGWQIQAGPIWLPQNDINSSVRYGCVQVPFKVEAPPPWAAQALAVYVF